MVEEKKRFLAFRNAAGRHGEIFRTRLKAVYVCVVTYPLSSRSPTSTPQFVKGDPRCRLQDSKFVSDKQNKHATASSASVSFPFFIFSLSLLNKGSRDFLPPDIKFTIHIALYFAHILVE